MQRNMLQRSAAATQRVATVRNVRRATFCDAQPRPMPRYSKDLPEPHCGRARRRRLARAALAHHLSAQGVLKGYPRGTRAVLAHHLRAHVRRV